MMLDEFAAEIGDNLRCLMAHASHYHEINPNRGEYISL